MRSMAFYKKIRLVFLVLSTLLMTDYLHACICLGITDAKVNLQNYPVVFIGVFTQIVHSDSLFHADYGSTMVQRYYNFKVLKSCKGLNSPADYVSVFPDLGSSCAGGLKYATLGDTVLIFANIIGFLSTRFLGVDQCTPYAILTKDLKDPYLKPNESELELINNTTIWRYPDFNNITPKKSQKKPAQYDWSYIALGFSVIFNLFFLTRTIRR